MATHANIRGPQVPNPYGYVLMMARQLFCVVANQGIVPMETMELIRSEQWVEEMQHVEGFC